MQDASKPRLRWYLLALSAATGTFVSAIPFSSLPVLFKEIADDLHLDLVQVGTVWGMTSLAGIFVSLIAGMLGDRFGTRMVLGLSCVLVGVTGALRGASSTFGMLTLIVFIGGIVKMVVPINTTKVIGLWFRDRLGMASGIVAMGMGFGLMLGPMISATVMSPLLGGWRNVLYLYGGVSAVVGILWFVVGRGQSAQPDVTPVQAMPMGKALAGLVRNRAVWLIGLTLMLRMSGIQGMTGYLPLYLRNQGWEPASADATLVVFYGMSTLSVIPLAALSDRIGRRKGIMLAGLVMSTVCLVLLPLTGGSSVWLYMVLSGIFMDGFMSIVIVLLLESEGVGTAHSGAALGMVFTIAQVGGVVAPPLGNSFARLDPGMPFIFWAALSAAGIATLAFTRETGRKARQQPSA